MSPPRTRLAVLLGILALALGALAMIGPAVLRREADRAVAEFTPRTPPEPRYAATVALVVVARGLSLPTDVQFVPDDPTRAVVLEKTGKARLLTLPVPGAAPASADSAPLVLDEPVRDESELGLLGFAFHPRWADNGLVYVNLTPKDGAMRSVIAEYELPPADLGKRLARQKRVILEVAQPYANHNAGQLAFGPDGMLYVGLGDGGSAGDPEHRAQDLGTLLGKMLRLDVDHAPPDAGYAAPADNPYVGRKDARPEIWASGLRNPWRYSFAPDGRLVVADVGQNRFEEVDLVHRGDDLGWSMREGRHCFPITRASCDGPFVDPVFEYGRALGVSVTGGYVATGDRAPSLRGAFVACDFGSGRMWALRLPPPSAARGASRGDARADPVGQFDRAIATFGRDGRGDLYVADLMSGELLAIVASASTGTAAPRDR